MVSSFLDKYKVSAFALICDNIKIVYWGPMKPSKVGHNEERRSYAEIRKYCDYNWTLKLSNSGINGVKNFSPVEFMHKYLGKTGNLRDLQSDNSFLADSLYYLLFE